jgi:hypothetical protein
MRKTVLLIIPLILLLTMACSITFTTPEIKDLRGSGNLVTEQREVSGFDRLEFGGVGTMTIRQGDVESLTIEADDNLIDHITTRVIGNRLVIEMEKNFNVGGMTRIHYDLVVKDLSRLTLSGFGDITMDELNTDSLTVLLSGSGNLTLADLQAESLDVTITGFGNSEFAGEVKDLQVIIKGAGSFKGGDLRSQTARVEVSGFGNATVWAERDLDVEITGSGNVSYYGLPDVTQNISGFGRLESLGNK